MIGMAMPEGFWWSWGVTAASAVATFLAVAVALFGQSFRDKFFPPILKLRLLNPDGEFTSAILKSPPDAYSEVAKRAVPARYYHLQVSNARRWSKATDLQVMLLRVEELGLNNEYRIAWTGALPLRWRHQELYPIARTIGAYGDLDLVSLVEGKGLYIHGLVGPTNLPLRRPEAVSLIFTLQAQANEADSPTIRVRVSWDGQWHEGEREMRDHLRIEELREPTALEIGAP